MDIRHHRPGRPAAMAWEAMAETVRGRSHRSGRARIARKHAPDGGPAVPWASVNLHTAPP